MARLQQAGQQPGVVAVLAACLHPPHCALVQELQEGGSLWHLLHEQGLRPQYGAVRTDWRHCARGGHCMSACSFVAGGPCGTIVPQLMDFVPAGTLLQLAEQIADAMHRCHSLVPPILHLDLKTQVLLLLPSAASTAKALSFGSVHAC